MHAGMMVYSLSLGSGGIHACMRAWWLSLHMVSVNHQNQDWPKNSVSTGVPVQMDKKKVSLGRFLEWTILLVVVPEESEVVVADDLWLFDVQGLWLIGCHAFC